MTDKSINFHIGGLFEKHELLKLFMQIFKDENYKFYPYVKIGSLFGSDKSSENLTVTEYVVASIYGYKVLSRMYELDGKMVLGK